jgi:hypothetical protein
MKAGMTLTHLSAAVLAFTLVACTRFEMRTLPPPEEGPVSVRAARITPHHSARIVVLRDVRITADSLIGWVDPDASGPPSVVRERLALSRDQVLLYEPRVHDWRASASVVTVSVIAVSGVALLYGMTLY